MNIKFEHYRDAIEFTGELLAERGWHKNEPRCGYQKRYLELENLLRDMEAEFQSQLPTVEDVQAIYRTT